MGGVEKKGGFEASAEGPETVGRRLILLNRLREKVFAARGAVCGWDWKAGMPESWCCSGRRWCSVLILRAAPDGGRDSMKLWMEPRRRGAVVAEEKDDSRRRVFWRVKPPVTAPKARDRELECAWWQAGASSPSEASFTASSAVAVSLASW